MWLKQWQPQQNTAKLIAFYRNENSTKNYLNWYKYIGCHTRLSLLADDSNLMISSPFAVVEGMNEWMNESTHKPIPHKIP